MSKDKGDEITPLAVHSANRVDQPRREGPPANDSAWSRGAEIALLLAVLVGTVLRVWQFSANRSLWLDEAGLALNVLARSGNELLHALDYGQMAPSGFLILLKFLTTVLGDHEWAFRMWPLVAGVFALALVALVARWILPPLGGVIAAGLFAVNHRLIFFSSEAKQYSGDVFATAMLVAIAYRVSRKALSLRASLALGAAGAVAGWLSHPAVFVMAGLGAALLLVYGKQSDRRSLRLLCAVFVAWALCLVPVLLVTLQSSGVPADKEYMMRAWGWALLPDHPFRLGTILWLAKAQVNFLGYLFEMRIWFLCILVVLCVLGSMGFWRDRRSFKILLLLPLLVGLGASLVRLFPMQERLGLWVLPSIVLLLGSGIARLDSGSWRCRGFSAALAGAALLTVSGISTLAAIPEYREELRPVLVGISERCGTVDSIYVYYGAVPAFRYYAPTFPHLATLSREGHCARHQWRRYIEEIVPLNREMRIWVVFSHLVEPSETDFILKTLDRLGRRLDVVESVGAAAYLYSFEAQSPESIADALTFVPANGNRSDPDNACLGGPTASRTWPSRMN